MNKVIFGIAVMSLPAMALANHGPATWSSEADWSSPNTFNVVKWDADFDWSMPSVDAVEVKGSDTLKQVFRPLGHVEATQEVCPTCPDGVCPTGVCPPQQQQIISSWSGGGGWSQPGSNCGNQVLVLQAPSNCGNWGNATNCGNRVQSYTYRDLPTFQRSVTRTRTYRARRWTMPTNEPHMEYHRQAGHFRFVDPNSDCHPHDQIHDAIGSGYFANGRFVSTGGGGYGVTRQWARQSPTLQYQVGEPARNVGRFAARFLPRNWGINRRMMNANCPACP